MVAKVATLGWSGALAAGLVLLAACDGERRRAGETPAETPTAALEADTTPQTPAPAPTPPAETQQAEAPPAEEPPAEEPPAEAPPAEEPPPQQARQAPQAAFPGGGGEGTVALERRVPDEVRVGEAFQYTLVVTNKSSYPVEDVVVRETVPKGMELDQDGFEAVAGRGVQWRIGTLAPDETREIEVTAMAGTEGEAQSCASVSFEPTLCSRVQVVKPELALTREIVDAKGRPVDTAYVCDDLFAVYTVTNNGSGATEPVMVREGLPEGVTTADGKRGVELQVGAVPPGESRTEKVQLRATRPAAWRSRAEAATEKLKVGSPVAEVRLVRPDVLLELDAPAQEYLGRAVSYTVRLHNDGEVPAEDVEVELPVPEGVERVSVSSQQIRQEGDVFRVGTLEAGETRTFQVTFEPTEPARLTTTAVARGYCVQAAEAEVATNVVGVPAVVIEVVDQNDPVETGGRTTYEIKVKNQGTAADLDLSLTAQLPPGMRVIDAQGDSEVRLRGNILEFAPLAELEPGQVATWHVVATPLEPGRKVFEVQLISEASQRPIIEMEPTTAY